jgi:hypothetical protein
VKRSFEEIFEIELTCWCYGISNAEEKADKKVLYRVIREFSGVFKEAVINLYTFDIVDTARKLINAGKCNVSEQEIAFYILSCLPNPYELTESQKEIHTEIIQKVEDTYGGAISRTSKMWSSGEHPKKKEPPSGFTENLEYLNLPRISK